MKKTTFDTIWDQIRQKYGVHLRLIEILPEAQLQTRPIPGMRSPAELIAHLSSGIVRNIIQGIATGTVQSEDETAIALTFEDKKDVLEFARECWEEADRIMLVAYPSLALLPDGRQVCPDGRAGMTVTPDFLLSENRARESMAAGERLDAVLEDTSKQNGWTFVTSHREQFRGRGICAGYTDNAFTIADDLRLPRWTGRKWEPFNPADWQAYAPRQRWFRTPNDAFLTAHTHAGGQIPLLDILQPAIAALYGGAFHPTAQGHAIVADHVMPHARRIVARP